FVTAGMGGGTGTGAAPIIAQTAKAAGALTVGVVTKPFPFEGKKRESVAERGIAELREHVDSLIVIPNVRLLQIADPKASFQSMMKMADDVLYNAVRGISDLITKPGIINVDFADVRTVMGIQGMAMMGTASAKGEDRAIKAATAVLTCPLLEDISITGAKSALVNVTASSELGMLEYNDAVSYITEKLGACDGDVIVGTALDENAGDELRITLIATGIDAGSKSKKPNLHPTDWRAVQTVGAAKSDASSPVSGDVSQPKNGNAEQNMQNSPAAGGSQSNPVMPSTPSQTGSQSEIIAPAGRDAFAFDSENSEISRPTYLRENHDGRAQRPDHSEDFLFDEDPLLVPAFLRRSQN
ncbi:MAG: cell division protein FtsZ, partial [Desulfovibrionaceae bacterium]|nr:cell division protein FtsZ [Desulfovibrionaceae bacterium]